MSIAAAKENVAAQELERRAMPRCSVDAEASLLVLSQGVHLPCRVVELSLSGCRLSSIQKLKYGIQYQVEVAFNVRGMAFRFGGVMQWRDDHCTVGINFGGMPERRREELIGVLREVEAENAAKAEKEAEARNAAGLEPLAAQVAEVHEEIPVVQEVVAQATPETPVSAKAEPVEVASPGAAQKQIVVRGANAVLEDLFPIKRALAGRLMPTEPEKLSVPSKLAALHPQPPPVSSAAPNSAQPPPKPGRERRTQSRHDVDTSVVLHLVHAASKLKGRILDMSLSGCRIHTDERFTVGIYTRVEAEFQLEGLPFRMGGVIQSIHNTNLVGIRFLDLSERKLDQLKQLVAEIEEMRACARHLEASYAAENDTGKAEVNGQSAG